MHACIALIKKLLVKSCYIWRRISLLLKVVPKCLMVLHRVEKKQLWIKQSCALALFYDFHFDSYQADTSLRSWLSSLERCQPDKSQSERVTIWLLRWWGGYGWFQEKISLRLTFGENKFLQGNTWRKKFLHWQKYLSRRVKLEKNFTPLYSRKKILSPEAKSFVPLSKVKWSAPKVLGMFSYDQLQVETPFWLNLCEASYFLNTLLSF